MSANLDPQYEPLWRKASDADVLRAAFPPEREWDNAALACVYHEFVQRALHAPQNVNYTPLEQRSTLREDIGAYVTAVILFSVVSFASALMLSGIVAAMRFGPVIQTLLFIVGGVWIPLVVTLIAFRAYLLRRSAGIRYTRCGVCGYILKGLTEPRCPECGERF